MSKKIISFIICILMLSSLISCNNKDDTSGTDTQSGTQSDTDSMTDSATSDTETQDPDIINSGNITEVTTIQTKKYYKEIESDYVKGVDGIVYEKDPIFLDSGFEIKKQSQYRVLSSLEELQAFTLLNRDGVDETVFEDNYIVAILYYFIGSPSYSRSVAGFYDAYFKNAETDKITMDTYYNGTDSVEVVEDVYRLYFIVVPKNEIEKTDGNCSITVNENVLESYNGAYFTESTTNETKAYFVKDKQAKENIEILDTVSPLWASYPFIAIHLDKAIETDFIVNGFKYENGEIYITVEIFEKSEMPDLHDKSVNLITVSLRPYYMGTDVPDGIPSDCEINIPDDIPSDCKINVIFNNVVSIN
ncbi:MAG: hypothetical protein ACI3XS_05925 [Eubacteriales bacterium]